MADVKQETQHPETPESSKVVPLKPIAKPVKKPAKKTAVKKKIAVKKVAKKQATKKTVAKKAAPPKQSQRPKQTPKASLNDTETFMKQSTQQFENFTKEAADLNRESVDAFVKSGQIFAKGFEDLIKQSVAVAQASAEKQAQFVQQAMGVKTINEFSDVQNKIAQANFDDFMSGATKLTELSTKILSEAVEPINNQVVKSMQKANV